MPFGGSYSARKSIFNFLYKKATAKFCGGFYYGCNLAESLIIKRMVADFGVVGAVAAGPAIWGFGGVYKVENARVDAIPLKANFGGNDALLGGRLVYRAVGGGGKLHAVLFIKDYTINGVRERA